MFHLEKLAWRDYSTLKHSDDTFSRVDKIPACDEQVDKRTDISII